MLTEEKSKQSIKNAPIVAIIGATGHTGKWILEGALEQGYIVRVLARTPSKLNVCKNLTIIKGDVNDLTALQELLSGVDVVLSCFGTVKKPHYIVESGMQTLIRAMNAQEKKAKLVHMSAIGLGSSLTQCKKSLVWSIVVKLIFPMVGKEVFADMNRGEQLIMDTKNLDFVIARAAILNDKQSRGYQAKQAHEPAGKMMISRQDIAKFMLNSVEDASYDGQAISIFSR